MSRVFKKGKYWYIDYVANGKRRREKVSRYKKLAEAKLHETEDKINKGEYEIPDDIAIGEFFDNLLAYKKEHAARNTVEKYRSVIRNFNIFRQKHYPVSKVSEISPAIVEKFQFFRVKQVSKKSANHDLKVLSAAFNWGIKRNHLAKNPAQGVERFKVETKLIRFLSKEEIRLILAHASELMYPAYMILLHTGIRKGELGHLEWKDVDFERRVLQITPKEGWTPKSKKAREIPINSELYKLLIEQRLRVKGRWVIEKTNGKSYDRGLWLNFKRFARRLGIEDVNIHTFRHTFASHLLMAGVDLVTVKELLGHSDLQTTMRYAHLAPSHKRKAVEALNSLSRVGTILAPEGNTASVS